jgi:hypothetical protein
MSTYRTVKIKKRSDAIEEIAAAAVLTPGMLLEQTSADTVQAHSTAGGNAAPIMVALEDELQGKGIGENFAATDKVQVWLPWPGDEFAGILADGQNVAIGDMLESAGNGYLQKHVADKESFESNEGGAITVYPRAIVGTAQEALDLSPSSGDEDSSGVLGFNKRIRVRVV